MRVWYRVYVGRNAEVERLNDLRLAEAQQACRGDRARHTPDR
ncbi:MAG: hypothetical protein QOK44_3510, partial [Betaproteobacteria bacterium]|nr:hypothetical protein [Betaproteobacteria bacterium]